MYFKAGGQVKERELTCTFSTLEGLTWQGPSLVRWLATKLPVEVSVSVEC
jgi:hypothetical protein